MSTDLPVGSYLGVSPAAYARTIDRSKRAHRIGTPIAFGTALRVVINGTTDWVYEEELSLREAFRWSPDGKQIAYWQFDTRGVGIFPLIYHTGKPREIATGIPYPGLGSYPSHYDTAGVQRVDEKNGWLYFLASPETSTQRALHRARLDGAGPPELSCTTAATRRPSWNGL